MMFWYMFIFTFIVERYVRAIRRWKMMLHCSSGSSDLSYEDDSILGNINCAKLGQILQNL